MFMVTDFDIIALDVVLHLPYYFLLYLCACGLIRRSSD